MNVAGDPVLAALETAPRHVNPAVALWLKLLQQGPLSAEDLLALSAEVEQTIVAGRQEQGEVESALRTLKAAHPAPSRDVPLGF